MWLVCHDRNNICPFPVSGRGTGWSWLSMMDNSHIHAFSTTRSPLCQSLWSVYQVCCYNSQVEHFKHHAAWRIFMLITELQCFQWASEDLVVEKSFKTSSLMDGQWEKTNTDYSFTLLMPSKHYTIWLLIKSMGSHIYSFLKNLKQLFKKPFTSGVIIIWAVLVYPRIVDQELLRENASACDGNEMFTLIMMKPERGLNWTTVFDFQIIVLTSEPFMPVVF